jgi:hypothetical protein
MDDARWREHNPKTAARQFLIRYYGLEHLLLVLNNVRGQRRELGPVSG